MENIHFHPNLIHAVEDALAEIFMEKKYADAVLERVLKQNPRWGGRDRRFIAETTYEMVRWWRWICECAEITEDEPQRFPKAVRAYFILNDITPPEWQHEGIAIEKIHFNKSKFENVRAVRESIPDWMDETGEKELGERWPAELRALNEQADVVLRANTLKVSLRELRTELQQSEIETETFPDLPYAVKLFKRTNVFQLDAFKNGFFEVQDGASQMVAPFAEVKEGMRVIDACAGAGGKTLHLAALLNNRGQIIALDVEERKLNELKRRARRAGATNIEARLIDSSKTIKRLHGSADRVLLDVPCSGLGVLKRNPDAKWKLSAEEIARMKTLQADILDRYSAMVKPGGKLIYSTCSILPSENELQVQQFLAKHNEFSLEEEKHVWPSQGFDGFYMARMKKNL